MPDDDSPFILDTDASDYAIGGVLSQLQGGQERVIAYAGRALSRNEINYCVTRKELLAVVNFTRYFRQYLLGKQFTIRTDHAALLAEEDAGTDWTECPMVGVTWGVRVQRGTSAGCQAWECRRDLASTLPQ